MAKLSIFCFFVFSSQAAAWLRPVYEDAVIVARSELIVTGHLEKNSIEYVPHDNKPDEGRSWEHHATLIASGVLKGDLKQKEIPIIIHYGLTPKVDGRFLFSGYGMSLPGNPKDAIEIWDTGNSRRSFEPIVKDAGQKIIWFLRRRSGRRGERSGIDKFGIVDPEDIQSLSLKNYFLAYLSKDPEKAVKDQLEQNPVIAKRAQRYLDHIEIQRIIKTVDTREKVEKLLPYYIRGKRWGIKSEAREGIISCGEIAGPYLRKMFDSTANKHLRRDIIRIWGAIKYKDCVPLLISLLTEHDKFWAKQQLQDDWWNADKDTKRRRKRQNIYGEVYYTVATLKDIGDNRAKNAVELTKQRWQEINFDNPQIVEECERALKVFSQKN